MSWASRFRLRQYVRASLWIVPLLGLVLGVVLAECAIAAHRSAWVPPGWHYSATTASGVLSAIVGAMIGLLGFVVTIGVLVVQQATGTLSPRYMRLWYRDRLQKAVLATFTGTFAFAFSLLRKIEPDDVPDLGVTLAGIGVAVSLVLLLVYLNRFTHNLRPVAIADLVRRMGLNVLDQALTAARAATPTETGIAVPDDGGPVNPVRAERGGAIQAFHVSGLRAVALRHDCVLVVTHRIGDFVPPGTVLVEVRGDTPGLDPRLLLGMIATGAERTIDQDPAFALRVLVDIAVRALSPAVNDPTTAVQLLDHIDAFLHTIARVELPDRHVLADDRGRPLLVVPGRTWEDYLELAVTEIREYGAGSLQICRRLRAVLNGLSTTVSAERVPAVRKELSLLDAAVQHKFHDPAHRALARTADRQGIGGGRRPETAESAD
ncbi:DUF2254 domain-containing protein [Streptomyces olivochromogenes]|nr:DUF2254 domain-containing protein [Streptomyces olivochromogenes]